MFVSIYKRTRQKQTLFFDTSKTLIMSLTMTMTINNNKSNIQNGQTRDNGVKKGCLVRDFHDRTAHLYNRNKSQCRHTRRLNIHI